MLADQLDVARTEPGLLAQLAPHGVDRSFAALEAALGQLPLAGLVDALERQHLPVVATHDRDDPCSEVVTSHDP